MNREIPAATGLLARWGFNEGYGKVLRYGAFSDEVLETCIERFNAVCS